MPNWEAATRLATAIAMKWPLIVIPLEEVTPTTTKNNPPCGTNFLFFSSEILKTFRGT
jgi:hypothetical protein